MGRDCASERFPIALAEANSFALVRVARLDLERSTQASIAQSLAICLLPNAFPAPILPLRMEQPHARKKRNAGSGRNDPWRDRRR